jgi:hypothetical protein
MRFKLTQTFQARGSDGRDYWLDAWCADFPVKDERGRRMHRNCLYYYRGTEDQLTALADGTFRDESTAVVFTRA